MAYYGGGAFTNVINTLQNYGVIDVLLPFVLIFSIVYAVLIQFGPFKPGTDGKHPHKSTNIIIALAIGILSIVPHIIGGGPDIVVMMQGVLPQVGLLIIGIVLLMVIAGLSKVDMSATGSYSKYIMWIPLAILGLIFTNAIVPQYMPSWMYVLNLNSDLMPIIVAILVMGLIIYFVVSEK